MLNCWRLNSKLCYKFLLKCLFGCTNLLNSSFHATKFHNHRFATVAGPSLGFWKDGCKVSSRLGKNEQFAPFWSLSTSWLDWNFCFCKIMAQIMPICYKINTILIFLMVNHFSGRVLSTRCWKLTGAIAPVEPVLTTALRW